MSGTVNISRKIWKSLEFKSQTFTEREAFIWMVMEASWKPRDVRPLNTVIHTERGQLACSVRFMAEAWGWEKSTVDRFLKKLKKRDVIGTETGTGINLITICNYDEFQNANNYSGTPKNTKAGQKRDSSGTNENKDSIRMKECKSTAYSMADAESDLNSVVDFQTAKDFVEHRWAMKKPLTKLAVTKMISQLQKHSNPKAVLDASVMNNWQGIFPEKVKEHGNGHYNGSNQGKRPDAALEQIARLAGLGQTQGDGRN